MALPRARSSSGIVLRPIHRSDVDRLRVLLSQLPPATRRACFDADAQLSTDVMRRLCDADGVQHVAWVAVAAGELVGLGRFVRTASDPWKAGIAVVVTDAMHGRGIGMRLLDALASEARALGIQSFSLFRATRSPKPMPDLGQRH